jgi:LysR family transcriptional activator of nhaA
MLLEQLSQHKLDMIISDCPIDSTQQEGLFSVKIGECGVSFWCINPPPEKPFPACLEERRLLVPGRRSMLGRKLQNWFNSQGLNVEILGEFDDAALMKAFGEAHNAIFVAPTLYAHDLYSDNKITEIGRVDNVMEEYHAIFAERMIQHWRCSVSVTGTTRRCLRHRQSEDIKKPALSGFFKQATTSGD